MKNKIEESIFILIPSIAILIDKSNIAVEGGFLALLLGGFGIAYLAVGWHFFRNKASKIKSLVFSIPISIVSFLSLIAILFKLQPWPNFNLLIISLISLGVLFFILVYSYVTTTSNQNKEYYRGLMFRSIVNAFVVIIFLSVEFNF